MDAPAAYDIHTASPAELEQALDLRRRVFCEEQGVVEAEEWDGRDGEAVHLVAIADGAVVGTCRLLFEGDTMRLGRMAVEAPARGRGIGSALIVVGERLARDQGVRRIVLNAQTAAESVYAGQGFEPHGERFEEAGIEHIAMEKALA